MITLTDEMKQAIRLIETTDTAIYITGKAGTGKTTFLKYIVNNIQKKFVITASTGIAAINAGGVTLHSLLSIPFGVLNPNETIKTGFNENKKAILNAIDVLIIDEISMVRPDVIDYVDRKLRIYRDNELPFGGVQIIMFGDLYQLPPVVTNNEKDILLQLYKGAYFFYAHVFRKSGFKIIELNRIFRQSDLRFIEILNHIRSYTITNEDIEDLEELRDKRLSNEFDNQYIHICSYKKDVQRINEELLGEPTHTFYAQLQNDFNINSAPCDRKLMLRVGARVMMLVNDRFHLYCNGSLGIVESIDDKTVVIKLDNGCTIGVERCEWTSYEYRMVDGKIKSVMKGSCKQFPITLAWAITIHKSQGLTFDKIVIHTQGVFCPGQLYVALSRCTSLQGIISDSFIDKRHILPDMELIEFEQAYKKADYFFDKNTYKLMKR